VSERCNICGRIQESRYPCDSCWSWFDRILDQITDRLWAKLGKIPI
jgi:hypothetical protein